MENKKFYGIIFLVVLVLVGEWAIANLERNFTSKFSEQGKQISIINEKITDLHNLYRNQIQNYKELIKMPGIDLVEINMTKLNLDNDTKKLCENTLLFFSSPSCELCHYNEAVLNLTNIPYKKVCKVFTAKDRETCAKDRSYLKLRDSDTLILAYHIKKDIPQLIWNCSSARIGTLANINNTAEFKDLIKKFGTH